MTADEYAALVALPEVEFLEVLRHAFERQDIMAVLDELDPWDTLLVVQWALDQADDEELREACKEREAVVG